MAMAMATTKAGDGFVTCPDNAAGGRCAASIDAQVDFLDMKVDDFAAFAIPHLAHEHLPPVASVGPHYKTGVRIS